MCVITYVETARPSDEQVSQMWDQNPKGYGGVAWRKGGLVHWKKGLNKDEMLAMNKTLPLPYVLHFRQPSNDTSDSLLACHPFQIDEHATTGLEGTFDGYVLFHNGMWSGWRNKLEGLALASFKRLPSGVWSDTRGLAWAAHWLGFGFLEMANEKVFCYGPGEKDIEMFGGPWLNVKVDGGQQTFIASNRSWERIVHRPAQEAASRLLTAAKDAISGTKDGAPGGAPRQDTFRSAHGGPEGSGGDQEAQQEQVQKGAEGVVQGDVERRTERSRYPLAGWSEGKKPKCTGCEKATDAGTIIGSQWFCYQCWAKDPSMRNQNEAARVPNKTLWVGTCQQCRVGSSGMKTIIEDKWLCRVCWETNGKPKMVYARTLVDQKAA